MNDATPQKIIDEEEDYWESVEKESPGYCGCSIALLMIMIVVFSVYLVSLNFK